MPENARAKRNPGVRAITASVTRTRRCGAGASAAISRSAASRSTTSRWRRNRQVVCHATCSAARSQCCPHSTSSAFFGLPASPNPAKSRMRVPFACPSSLTMSLGMATSNANRIPLSRGPQIITGGLGSSIEWMSSRKSAASTNGRSSRARRSSVLSRGPSSVGAFQTRLKSSSTKRVA